MHFSYFTNGKGLNINSNYNLMFVPVFWIESLKCLLLRLRIVSQDWEWSSEHKSDGQVSLAVEKENICRQNWEELLQRDSWVFEILFAILQLFLTSQLWFSIAFQKASLYLVTYALNFPKAFDQGVLYI